MFGVKKTNNSPNGKAGNASAHNSLVAGTVIVGNIVSATDIRIDGKLEGNLKSEAKVVIGKNAVILGDIVCQIIIIEGKVEGNIDAREKLHIKNSGIVAGDLTTNKLIIEDGAQFNGASVMGKASIRQNEEQEHGKQEKIARKKAQKAS